MRRWGRGPAARSLLHSTAKMNYPTGVRGGAAAGAEPAGARGRALGEKERAMSSRRRGSLLRCACAAALVVGLTPSGALAAARGHFEETPPH